MNIRTIVEDEKLNIEKSILEKEKLIGKLPEGTLQIHKSRNTFNWIHKIDISESEEDKTEDANECNFERRYIPKHNKNLAENLAYKGYLQAQLKDDLANLMATNTFLKNYRANDYAEKYIRENPGRRELLMQKIHDSDNEIKRWMQDIYTGEVPEKQNLRYMSQAGFNVRSKSEQIIVALLMKYQVPFKYEQHVLINNNNWYPDFMIMHPQTHKIYIWEHLGMMDSYKYRNRNFEKINDFCVMGFAPGDNLILTFETDKSGIDEILVEKLIQHYFA